MHVYHRIGRNIFHIERKHLKTVNDVPQRIRMAFKFLVGFSLKSDIIVLKVQLSYFNFHSSFFSFDTGYGKFSKSEYCKINYIDVTELETQKV